MRYRIKLKILMALNLIWIGSNIYLIFDYALSEQYLGALCYFILYFFSLCMFYSIKAEIKVNKERSTR